MSEQMRHPAEPWTSHESGSQPPGLNDTTYFIDIDDASDNTVATVYRSDLRLLKSVVGRSLACVNAMANIHDPAAWVKRAKAIEEAVCNAQTWLEAPPLTESDKYAARTALLALRAALALPGAQA